MEEFEKHWSGERPASFWRGDILSLALGALAGVLLAEGAGFVLRLLIGGQ